MSKRMMRVPVQVLTWNLYQRPWFVADFLDTPRLPDRRDRFLGILRSLVSHGADIVCLQEVFHGPTRRALERRFEFSFAKLTHRFCLRMHSGLMILSRHPIVERSGLIFHGRMAGGRGADAWVDKGIMRARILLPDGPLEVFNTHLQAGPCADVREAQLDLIRRFLDQFPGRSILTGDFNLESCEDHRLDSILRLGYRDAWLDARPQDYGATKEDGGQRFDRMFVRGFDVSDVELVCTRWSDHSCLRATMEANSMSARVGRAYNP
jgi:endonuclease/exonuclease/phosphatase family metal-dependent hydrolase